MDSQELFERYRELVAICSSFPAKLVAVSKARTADEIEALYRMGHRDFGENYVQELLKKQQTLDQRGIRDIRWHFIGHLQTNKVKQLLPIAFAIHSVDSVRLAREISQRALGPVSIFLEVNVDQEESKFGFSPEEIPRALAEIKALPRLIVRGLMCIPSSEHSGGSEPFRRLRQLRDTYRLGLGLGELSMGMSSDYLVALQEGSNWIRVGTALFGPRPKSR